MAELYEVLLIDGASRWHAGWLMDDETEIDVLVARDGKVLLFGSRAALEHHAQEAGLELKADLPDEIDLDLGGWLPLGTPEPPASEVLQLWQLLIDDPVASRPLTGEEIEEAYDDLLEPEDDWFEVHGRAARSALSSAVSRLRGAFAQT